MYEDRLKPRYCSSRWGGQEVTPKSLSRPGQCDNGRGSGSPRLSISPQQQRAKAIVRKYRRNVRYSQLYKLKSLVPAVAEREEASEMDVLQETVKYIEDLERRLLERVQASGSLPTHLAKLERLGDPARSATLPTHQSENPTTPVPAAAVVQPTPASAAASLQIHDLRNLLHTSLQPVLERRLKQQRMEDECNLKRLIQESASCSAGNPTSQ